MDSGHRASGLGEEGNSSRGKGKGQHRHSAQQIQQLEAFFKENAHPDENQRKILGHDLGLDPNQIRFWFQNKRTLTKTQSGKLDSSALRSQNETLRFDNFAMHEILKTAWCTACNGPCPGGGDRQGIVQELRSENAFLKQEFERRLCQLNNFTGMPNTLAPGITNPLDLSTNNPILPNPFNAIQEMDEFVTVGASDAAMDELVELLGMNENDAEKFMRDTQL